MTLNLSGHSPHPVRPAGFDRPKRTPYVLLPDDDWNPTPALRRALVIVTAALGLGLILDRIDLLLAAMPLALGLVASLTRRPVTLPELSLDGFPETPQLEGGRMDLRLRVGNADAVDLVAVARPQVSQGIRLTRGGGRQAMLVPEHGTATAPLTADLLRWGTHRFGPVEVRAQACDGLLRSRQLSVPKQDVTVYPRAALFDSRQSLPRAAGLAGVHHTRRPGDGGELAEVRRFAPGDRLRSIDWRVSLRQRELHVNATYSERDADVLILLDILSEAGQPGRDSSLDVTVRAAAAIAEHYTSQGDRVAMAEFGAKNRRLRPGGGRRHYALVQDWLTGVNSAGGDRRSAAERQLASKKLPGSAAIIMLTPLLDPRSTSSLARLAQTGRPLVAVDTLPRGVCPPFERQWTQLAFRLWHLERDNTLNRLRALGIPVESWMGPGSLDHMLRQVALLDHAPKLARR